MCNCPGYQKQSNIHSIGCPFARQMQSYQMGFKVSPQMQQDMQQQGIQDMMLYAMRRQMQMQMEIQAYELFKEQYRDPDDEECFFDENEENFTE